MENRGILTIDKPPALGLANLFRRNESPTYLSLSGGDGIGLLRGLLTIVGTVATGGLLLSAMANPSFDDCCDDDDG